MTLKSCEKLIQHYRKLIENPDMAFPANARIKPAGRESVIEHAKKHLADMEDNLKIREYLKSNPDMKLNPQNLLKKLKVPVETAQPKKEKSKK